MFEREPIVGTMSAQVAKILGMRVVSGEFRPGDALPIEEELCVAYGVSRTTIREAIKQLAAKRLVDVQPKVGTRVLPFADWNLLDRDVLAWRLHAQFDAKIVEDIYEMRLCFEPRATALAAKNGSKEDHALLERRYRELVSAYETPGDGRLAAEADLEFHLAIINMSRNGMFITIGGGIKAALRVSAEMLQRQQVRLSEDLVMHEALLKQVMARRPELAAKAMVKLLTASRDRVLSYTVKG
jgi:DNA-binding FadR family transcriptional regulator